MFDAAMRLILEVGTQKTTLKEVGERADYSRGLANARFGSKDQLFMRLADRCRQQWVEALQNKAEGKAGLDVLMSRLDAMIAFAERYPDEARVMCILWFESVGAPSEINASLARFHQQARDDIRTLALEGAIVSGRGSTAKAKRFAVRFCGTLFGLCYQWLVDAEAVDIRKNIEDMKRTLATTSSGQE